MVPLVALFAQARAAKGYKRQNRDTGLRPTDQRGPSRICPTWAEAFSPALIQIHRNALWPPVSHATQQRSGGRQSNYPLVMIGGAGGALPLPLPIPTQPETLSTAIIAIAVKTSFFMNTTPSHSSVGIRTYL